MPNVADDTVYVFEIIDAGRTINVDFVTPNPEYPTYQFLTTFTVTVTGSRAGSADLPLDFDITIYDCKWESQTIPATTPDVYVYKSLTATSSISTASWTTDSRCYDLTLGFDYDDGSGTWTEVSSSSLPPWVQSFTHGTSGTDYTLDITFEALSAYI